MQFVAVITIKALFPHDQGEATNILREKKCNIKQLKKRRQKT